MRNKTAHYIITLLAAVAIAMAGTPISAQEISGDFGTGSVKVGYDGRSCTASLEGAIRYNSGSGGGGCDTTPTEFTTPGTDTYSVPASCTSVQIETYGAGGGGASSTGGGGAGGGSVVERTDTTLLAVGGGGGGGGSTGPGGGGGYGLATVSVTPAETLNIWVGGGGSGSSSSSGGNGGAQAGGSGGGVFSNGGGSTYGGGGGGGGGGGFNGGTSTYGGGGGGGTNGGDGKNSTYGGGGGAGMNGGIAGTSTNGNNGGSSFNRYGGGGGYFGDSGSIGSNGSGSTGGAAANSGPGNGGNNGAAGSNGKVVITPVGGGGSPALEFCDGSSWTEFWGAATIGAGSPMPSSMNPCYGNGSGTCLFKTSNFWNGNLGGLSGADTKCASAATGAGLTGTYKAVISSSTTNAKDRFTVTYPVVAPNGIIIEDSNLWAGALEIPPIYDEDSIPFAWITVWTGSDSAGVKTANHCTNWTSSSSGVNGTIGRNDMTNSEWLEDSPGFSPGACNGFQRLYCMLATGL